MKDKARTKRMPKEGKPRQKTPSFILELPLRVDWSQERRVRAHLESARCLYNALLTEANQRLRKMRSDPAWEKARLIPRKRSQERARRLLTCARSITDVPFRKPHGFSPDSYPHFTM